MEKAVYDACLNAAPPDVYCGKPPFLIDCRHRTLEGPTMLGFPRSRKSLLAVLVLFPPVLVMFLYACREIAGHNEEDVFDGVTG